MYNYQSDILSKSADIMTQETSFARQKMRAKVLSLIALSLQKQAQITNPYIKKLQWNVPSTKTLNDLAKADDGKSYPNVHDDYQKGALIWLDTHNKHDAFQQVLDFATVHQKQKYGIYASHFMKAAAAVSLLLPQTGRSIDMTLVGIAAAMSFINQTHAVKNQTKTQLNVVRDLMLIKDVQNAKTN